jgi:hypothetical protein
MRLASITALALCAAASGFATLARAGSVVVIDYEDLSEGMQGDPLTHMGVTYYDLNNVSGSFPSGETFEPAPGDEFVIENAGLLYNDFPSYGSPVNALTFGIAFIPGDNLTIGGLSTVTMDLDSPAQAVSLDLAFYENGPWGGIEFLLDALSGDTVVGGDSFSISNLGGRDNPAVATLSVSGVTFDRLHLYATWGNDYSMPRAMIDDLTLTYGDPSPTIESSWGAIKNTYRP